MSRYSPSIFALALSVAGSASSSVACRFHQSAERIGLGAICFANPAKPLKRRFGDNHIAKLRSQLRLQPALAHDGINLQPYAHQPQAFVRVAQQMLNLPFENKCTGIAGVGHQRKVQPRIGFGIALGGNVVFRLDDQIHRQALIASDTANAEAGMKSMNKNGIRVLETIYINLSAPESWPNATHNGTKHPVCIRVMRIQPDYPTLIAEFGRFIDRKFGMHVQKFCNLVFVFTRDNRTGDISQTTARCDETGTFGQNFLCRATSSSRPFGVRCHLVSGARRHRPDPLHGTSDTTSWHRSESRISFPAIWRTMLTPARFTRAAIGVGVSGRCHARINDPYFAFVRPARGFCRPRRRKNPARSGPAELGTAPRLSGRPHLEFQRDLTETPHHRLSGRCPQHAMPAVLLQAGGRVCPHREFWRVCAGEPRNVLTRKSSGARAFNFASTAFASAKSPAMISSYNHAGAQRVHAAQVHFHAR